MLPIFQVGDTGQDKILCMVTNNKAHYSTVEILTFYFGDNMHLYFASLDYISS